MRRRYLPILLVALVVAIAACSPGGDPVPPPTSLPVAIESYAARGPHGVGVTTIELVDTTRPTVANGDFAGAPERRVQVEIWYPAAAGAMSPEERDAALDGGPYPLIIFAHGFSSSRVQSASYTQHLASHGYIVASPDFPASFGGAPGGPRLRAVIEQPADATFVIDELLLRSNEPASLFAGAIDPARIGMTGHSLGGLTTLMATYGPLRDDRIVAALPISPPGCFFEANAFAGEMTPLMVLGGSEEMIVDPTSIRKAYDLANAPRYFVELAGADHIKFGDIDFNDRDIGGSDIVTRIAGDTLIPDSIAIAESIGGSAASCVTREGPKGKEFITGDRQRELLRLFGALFFDAHLRGNEGAKGLLRGGGFASIAPEAAVEFE